VALDYLANIPVWMVDLSPCTVVHQRTFYMEVNSKQTGKETNDNALPNESKLPFILDTQKYVQCVANFIATVKTFGSGITEETGKNGRWKGREHVV
jgi:hypothetical protein